MRNVEHREKNLGSLHKQSMEESEAEIKGRMFYFVIFSLFWNFMTIFCDCTGGFVSDLVGNPEDRFPCVAAQNTLSISE